MKTYIAPATEIQTTACESVICTSGTGDINVTYGGSAQENNVTSVDSKERDNDDYWDNGLW